MEEKPVQLQALNLLLTFSRERRDKLYLPVHVGDDGNYTFSVVTLLFHEPYDIHRNPLIFLEYFDTKNISDSYYICYKFVPKIIFNTKENTYQCISELVDNTKYNSVNLEELQKELNAIDNFFDEFQKAKIETDKKNKIKQLENI